VKSKRLSLVADGLQLAKFGSKMTVVSSNMTFVQTSAAKQTPFPARSVVRSHPFCTGPLLQTKFEQSFAFA
jgi:hypothetical protein